MRILVGMIALRNIRCETMLGHLRLQRNCSSPFADNSMSFSSHCWI